MQAFKIYRNNLPSSRKNAKEKRIHKWIVYLKFSQYEGDWNWVLDICIEGKVVWNENTLQTNNNSKVHNNEFSSWVRTEAVKHIL